MSCAITIISELWPFDSVFMLILCNLHSCTLHNSLTVHEISMEFYRNVYKVKLMCCAQK